jgi:hypothetical protein
MVAVIDLGERRVVDLESSRPVDWRRLRRIALAVLSLVGVLRRSADGSVQGNGRVALSPGTNLFAVGDYLAGQPPPGAAATTFTIYDPATLAALWHATGQVTDCGPVICVLDDAGVTAREPGTGAVLWSVADAVEAEPAGGGRVLVDTGAGDSLGWRTGPYRLVDARSGRLRTGPFSGFLASPNGQSGAASVLLHSVEGQPDGLAVVRLEPEADRMIGLGTVPRAIDSTCSARGDLLACQAGATLIVTGLR